MYWRFTGDPINPYQRELVSRGVILGEISGKLVDIKLKHLRCPQEYKILSGRGRNYLKQQKRYDTIYLNELKWEMLKGSIN